ncbi:MAG: NACHT domain-containing protein [Alphaproteobacteria bacterium]|nr:NACHT domain-containing protein [Alphaproteobacteria bacterium]
MVKSLRKSPPENVDCMSAGEILNLFRRSIGLSFGDLALEASPPDLVGGYDENTAKGWIYRGAIPKQRDGIERTIRQHAADEQIAQAWWSALERAWEKQKIAGSNEKKSRLQHLNLIKKLQLRVLSDRQITRLPALFETDHSLPLAHAYVDLRIAPAVATTPAPRMMEQRPTLAEKLRRRIRQRNAIRRSPREALDQATTRCRLIVGAPGTGKSSLLRRLALDIAAGEWATASVPFFVEARGYVQARAHTPSLSLVDYASQKLAAQDLDAAQVRALLTGTAEYPDGPGILLIDGLDEIASDKDAVNSIYSELANPTTSFSWIATTRPAGLMQGLNEDQRFEMVELDSEAVAALIENWCAANANAGLNVDATALAAELDRVPGMREMSANPFLLTALCFLKSTAPNESLPLSRIEVYETLLQRVAHQARCRHGDPEILSTAALDDLSRFACFLYDSPRGAVQIFAKADWTFFAGLKDRELATDFERQILPSRLLTVWHEADPKFHFLHLTLQEHLVAQAMLDWPVSKALQRRFSPAWRSVFRFYGALLWQRGRHAEFGELTEALYREQDINRLSLITLSEIFADAGLKDTSKWIGDDLRHELLHAASMGDDGGAEAFLDALAALDPDWLILRTLGSMDDTLSRFVELARDETAEEDYPGHNYVTFGRGLDSPYLRLARARSTRPHPRISEAFWGDDQPRALMAAYAYAETAKPHDRDRVVAFASALTEFDDDAKRAFAFAQASRSKAFLPFLDRITKSLSMTGESPYSEAVFLVADIGGAQAAKILSDRLADEFVRYQEPDQNIEMCARAVVRLGGQQSLDVLAKAHASAPTSDWREFLQLKRISASPDNDQEILKALSDPDLMDAMLGALGDAASFGRLPSPEVVAAIGSIADHHCMTHAIDLAMIEDSRLEAGLEPQLCEPILAIATEMAAVLKDAPVNETTRGKIRFLQYLFEVLGKARWQPARKLADQMLEDEATQPELLSAAIDMVGMILFETGDEATLKQLEALLYDDGQRADIYDVSLAIGRIDLERLFRLQAARSAANSLERISTETDRLIFDSFWTDRSGKITKWVDPPPKVLHAVDEKYADTSELIAHEMSRWELSVTHDAPEECIAALVFEPLEGHLRHVAQEAETLFRDRGGGGLYRIPPGISDNEAKTLARTIAQALVN